MYFTQEDYIKIESWLKLNAKRDSDFPDADLGLRGDEFLVIVQEGENRKLLLTDFIRMCGGTPTIVAPPKITISTDGKVTITSDYGSIYYTIDGSTPTKESLLYSTQFTLTDSATVKAVVYYEGVYSLVTTQNYIKQQPKDPIYYGYLPSSITGFTSRAQATVQNITVDMLKNAIQTKTFLNTTSTLSRYEINSTGTFGYTIALIPETYKYTAKLLNTIDNTWLPFDTDNYNSNGNIITIEGKKYKLYARICLVVRDSIHTIKID